jgi:hypothetical protein
MNVYALDGAKRTVLVQAYSLTSAPIAKALVDAHHRGVTVEVVLDKSQHRKRYSSAVFVAHAGIPTRERRQHKPIVSHGPSRPRGFPRGLPCHSAEKPPPTLRRSCQGGDARSNLGLESQGGSPPRDHQAPPGHTSAAAPASGTA